MTRTRTPSGLKWVASELAAIKGELTQVDVQIEQLTARRAQLEVQHACLSQVGAVMGVAELQDVVPAVRVHKAYGGRGYLMDWLREMLKAAAPRAVATSTLALLAEKHFKLELHTPQARWLYQDNTLGRALRKLVALGLVERLHDPASAQGLGLWRWQSEPAALAKLLASAALEETS